MIVKLRIIWYLISIFIALLGGISILRYGLNFDVDFIGGSVIQVKFEEDVTKNDIASALKKINITPSSIVKTSKNEYRIKIKESEESLKNLKQKIFKQFEAISKFDKENTKFLSISPIIGKELKNKVIKGIIIGVIVILIYILFVFKKGGYFIPSYIFGISGIIALIHDAFITLGVFNIFSQIKGYEFSIPVAAAILTILGYSINDTIIIFDRIRENIIRENIDDMTKLITISVRQTLPRSINTSLTTLIVISIVAFLGSKTLFPFLLTLGAGIVVGTYSSIFIAAPLLYDLKKLFAKSS